MPRLGRLDVSASSSSDIPSRAASLTSEGGVAHTTVWSVWCTGPLARHFLREWAKGHKGHSSEAALISKALLKLSDDDPLPEDESLSIQLHASSSAFLRSSHGMALKELQQVVGEAPREEHFTAPQIIARGSYGAVFHTKVSFEPEP